MGWSFRKSFRVAPGVRLNLSKRGLGWSVGGKGLRFGVSGGKGRVSSGVGPFRFSKALEKNAGAPAAGAEQGEGGNGCCGCFAVIIALFCVGAALAASFGSGHKSRHAAVTPTPRASIVAATPVATPKALVYATPRATPAARASAEAQQHATQKYPSLGQAGSPLHREFLSRIRYYQRAQSQIFDDPEWPSKIAGECALSLARPGGYAAPASTPALAAILQSEPSSGPTYFPGTSGKTVSVEGYFRKDGTYVRPHMRKAPRR